MNILFVTTEDIYKNTSSNIRNVGLIKGLHEAGCKIVVASLASGSVPDNILKSQLRDTAEVYRIGADKSAEEASCLPPNQSASGINSRLFPILLKIYNRFKIYDPYVFRIRKFKKSPLPLQNITCVISSSDPKSSHLFAKRLIKHYNISAPWIQYWGDPLTGDVTNQSVFGFLSKTNESRLLKSASRVIYTNPLTAEHMKMLYQNHAGKINWAPTSAPDLLHAEHIQETGAVLTLGYFGDYFTAYRNICPLIDTVSESNDRLIICGNGDADIAESPNIEIHARVSLEAVTNMQRQCGVLVVLCNNVKFDKNGHNTCTQVPGKLYHYAQLSKYVLVISDADEIEKCYSGYNRYVFCKNNKESISDALEHIRTGRYANLCAYVDAFTPVGTANTFLNIISAEKNKSDGM